MFVVITDLNGTTKSPKSQRLKERKRKNQACANKLSPGLIFSDSEEESDLNFQSKNVLNVVDVCSNRELFSTFLEELKEQKTISITVNILVNINLLSKSLPAFELQFY